MARSAAGTRKSEVGPRAAPVHRDANVPVLVRSFVRRSVSVIAFAIAAVQYSVLRLRDSDRATSLMHRYVEVLLSAVMHCIARTRGGASWRVASDALAVSCTLRGPQPERGAAETRDFVVERRRLNVGPLA